MVNCTKVSTRMIGAGIVLFALICVFLGYLLIGERGLYMDDYSARNQTVNIITGVYQPSMVPLQARYLALSLQQNLAGLAKSYELPIRWFFTVMIAFNAALLSWLIYRILRSRLAAVVSGWLFAVPFIAFEATLWLMQLGLYVPGVFFMLVFLHMSLSALAAERKATLWIMLSLAAYIIAILFLEQTALVAFAVPLLAWVIAGNSSGARVRLVRSFVLGLTALALAGLVFGLLYVNNIFLVQSRGGLDFDPLAVLQRIPQYYERFAWMVAGNDWGLRLTGDTFLLGFDAIRSSLVGKGLAIAAGVLLTLIVWFWRHEHQQASPWRAAAVLIAGAFWFMATIIIPGIFVKGQIIEYRMLYIPLAGACAAAGAFVCLVTRHLDRPAVQKAALALSGVVALFSTVCLTGYCRAYVERYALDQREIAALRLALPGEMLPADAYIIPLDADFKLFDSKEAINWLMTGVFETPWSSNDAIQQAYRRSDLQSLASNKWSPIVISQQTAQPLGQVVLRVEGTPIPLDRTIFFSYHKGQIQIYEMLAITQKSGRPQLIPLPLAQRLRHEKGLQTVTTVTIPAPQVEQ